MEPNSSLVHLSFKLVLIQFTNSNHQVVYKELFNFPLVNLALKNIQWFQINQSLAQADRVILKILVIVIVTI